MTILAIFCALIVSSWVGTYLGARGLRKEVAAAKASRNLWEAEALRVGRNLGAAEDKIDKLKAQLADTNAKLVCAHRQIQLYDRVRGGDGRFEKAAQ